MILQEKEGTKEYLEINSLGVNERYRRKHIGETLLYRCITLSKTMNAKYASLLVRTKGSDPAIGLYSKLGFKLQHKKVKGLLHYIKEY